MTYMYVLAGHMYVMSQTSVMEKERQLVLNKMHFENNYHRPEPKAFMQQIAKNDSVAEVEFLQVSDVSYKTPSCIRLEKKKHFLNRMFIHMHSSSVWINKHRWLSL